ncbi:GH36-type glycosyl hydrolase domain-containing protein [Massilia sp. Leaf139]|uniref:GH36-type glycosyl hydrolase domain-containing protein n=1 Tax=Massilia sp. Leaf139 TaxID=1736272 RepID=UPI000AF98A58|nr:glucoamylase family protein [Massilia sp. Leaf139]
MNDDLHTKADAPRAGYVPVRAASAADGAPLRAGHFDAAQMALHGSRLAAQHVPARAEASDRLQARLEDNAAAIGAACASLTRAEHGGLADPSATLLLDHYHLVDEQIRSARQHLPRACGTTLPHVAGPTVQAGAPRIHQLALDCVAYSDGLLAEDSLAGFVAAYQENAALTLGELGAFPTMLRLALLENLRRLAVRLAERLHQRGLAADWAGRMMEAAEHRAGDLILLVADMARAVQPLDAAFVAALAQRLQGQGAPLAQVLDWIGVRLADAGLTLDAQQQRDEEESSLDAVSLANSLASLRLVERIDWSAFLEAASTVERTLRRDPAGVYPAMDAATRAHYRQAVAGLARASGRSEDEIAAEALALAAAQRTRDGTGDARTGHVGHYLVGAGLATLRARHPLATGMLPALRRAARRRPLLAYLGAIGGFTLLFTVALVVHAYQAGAGASLLLALGLLAAFGASQLAATLTGMMAARLVKARPLPRMDVGAGIPQEARTVVALPALLQDSAGMRALCERLEESYLANRDPQLRFCLLTDFADAPEQTVLGDAELLEELRAGIAALNERHDEKPFVLLHRPRVWSASEYAWIGRERRRGQLADLNAYLRGGARERFIVAEGAADALDEVRYVIALDAGTRLPMDSARRMVAAMLHPLNRPLFESAGRRVVAGHAFLQPRTGSALPAEGASRYQRLCGATSCGCAESTLYQHLFGEGASNGKGIYEVDAFTRVLDGRLPDNTVLSHELLEGCYLRSGVLDDVELVETCPPHYSDEIARRHRGIRGDWQLTGWLRARVPARDGGLEPNPLTPLARWKLVDALRRSLVAPALMAMLVLCWARLPGPAFWSAAALSVFFLPAFIRMGVGLADKPHGMLWRQHLSNWAHDAANVLAHAVLNMAFLPHEAWYSLHAIARTGWRMLVSRRRLLQWRASHLVRASTDVESAWRSMWFAPLLAVGVAVLLTFLHPFALFAAAPLLLLWFLSPLLAWWLSLPFEPAAPALSAAQTRFLATLARRTWRYFEDVVDAATNWLPPGGLQELPQPAMAHATSPTAIGLSLLANLTAWDFGFIPQATVLARVRAAFSNMALLERHRGHYYAAYDTDTLAPLQPLRVSTEDSGNLAAYLLTLGAGLERLADAPVASLRSLDGLRTTFQVLEAHAQGAPRQVRKALDACRDALEPERCRSGDTLPGLADCLGAAVRAASMLTATLPPDADVLLRDWAVRLDADCRAVQEDLLAQAPWMRAVQEYVLDASLTRIPTLRELAGFAMPASGKGDAEQALAQMVEEGAATARERLAEIETLAACAREFADMDVGLLFDPETRLLASGYEVGAERREAGAVEMLASSARLASFVGIAHGQLPQGHWFALKRPLCYLDDTLLLQSQTGALGDYLLPRLVMPGYRSSLLERACRAIVRVQIDAAARYAIPWGMSDSGYNSLDGAQQYASRAFGVPGSGIVRGQGDERVVAPYASLLALMVAPEAACANLERMATLGAMGAYGFYEALDYTPARLAHGQRQALVRAYRSDHQAVGLLALSYLLHAAPMQARFAADPELRAALPLLQERMPSSGAFEAAPFTRQAGGGAAATAQPPVRTVTRAGLAQPQVQLLSNGRYQVMVTSDGAGYSRWNGLALTRWRADATSDNWGLFCYLRDLDSGAVWSSAWQPTLAQPDHYEATFPAGRAGWLRRNHGIELCTEIVVPLDDDVELRRTRIRNLSERPRRIEVTSYTEPVLAPGAFDDAHPAFSKLFVQTEIVAAQNAIVCTRRPRDEREATPWLVSALALHGVAGGATTFETSRADFIRRGREIALPAALTETTPLDGAAGAVLDPALAIRRSIDLAPGEEVTLDLLLGVAENRDAALGLAAKYGERSCADRAFAPAPLQAPSPLREADAALYARLAGAVLYPQRALRADQEIIARNRRGQSGLWPYAISGDLPIVLARIDDAAGLALARELLAAHAWWRERGLEADLVLWCGSGGQPSLHTQLVEAIGPGLTGAAGGVHLQVLEQVPEDDQVLLQAIAHVVLSSARGSLMEQLQRAQAQSAPVLPNLLPAVVPPDDVPAAVPLSALLLDNGIGGFSQDGREYLIRIRPGQPTPAPWSNVLASPRFGSVVSESGQAYTWCENARELRLTPWDNDPVRDRGGEVFYLRDEATGVAWSPTALPAPSGGDYLTRHGFGYSVFEHSAHGIHSELTSFVALDAPLKYAVLRVRNDGAAPRRLSATGYVEWVLGELRAASSMHVVTERDAASGALLARSAWNSDDADRVAFFHVDAEDAAFTCDRMEFIGRGGSLAQPQALRRSGLAGSLGAALDPCAVLQVAFELAPGERKELVFMLGAAEGEATELIARYRGSVAARAVLEQVHAYWEETLGAVHIETPDPALDVLANGWLVYQAIACRMWARASYYQAGGAFGFRDQLQDAMALVHTRPQLLREHLLLCAAHQFVEGDVQHWWLPPSNRGVRTRCSDDLLWLPLAACRYVRATGDFAVLGEAAPYLEGRALEEGEESYFDAARVADGGGDLYEHCVRAIRHSLRFGEHGLPLIGSGDWNDGLDRVGTGGRGESVWLGFFMIEVLRNFAELADRRADYGFATTCRAAAQALATQLENHAWDGEWYRRAWFDDGTPLGSKDGGECRIDLVSQSWSVLSGAAGAKHAASAMAAVEARLVRREARLIQLFDPPFEGGSQHPGSLEAYAPGLRDNGGQATHAALWAAMAFARMGDGERAWELFDMLNPVRLAATAEDCRRYRLEPYVVAGDVIASAPHIGRGGWSWYTGAAGWMYRLIVESLLGIERIGERLVLAPRLPRGWPGFTLRYRYRSSSYAIEVRTGDTAALLVDGVEVGGDTVRLLDDGAAHRVELQLAPGHGAPYCANHEQPQSKTIT